MKKAIQVLLTAVLALVTLAVIIIYSYANIFHYTANMDADIAAETMLAQVLYQNGHIQPDTWFASTANRILGAPLLASFIYPLTGFDLNIAMGLACSIMIFVLVATMLFFCRQIGFSTLESLVAVLLMLVMSSPSDDTQRMLYLYASYYVGHFICMFLLLGFYAMALKMRMVPLFVFVITIPMAVLNGVQGMHANMFFYMPLLGTEILRRIVLFLKKKKADSNVVTIWVILVSAISLVCTKIFGGHMGETSRNIRHAPEKFVEVVWPMFKEVLGYGRWPLLIILFIVLAIAGYLLMASNLKEKPELWSALPILFGVIVTVLAMTFSTIEVAPRYLLMQVFVVGVGTSLLMHLFKPEMSYLLALLVLAYGVNSAFFFYEALIVGDSSFRSEYVQVTDWMMENGYTYGYSTFDHSSVMTVMSDDKVKVRPLINMNKLEPLCWDTDKTWYPPYRDASEKVCYVVSQARTEDFQAFVEREHPQILETKAFDVFVVYVTDHDYTKPVE